MNCRKNENILSNKQIQQNLKYEWHNNRGKHWKHYFVYGLCQTTARVNETKLFRDPMPEGASRRIFMNSCQLSQKFELKLFEV